MVDNGDVWLNLKNWFDIAALPSLIHSALNDSFCFWLGVSLLPPVFPTIYTRVKACRLLLSIARSFDQSPVLLMNSTVQVAGVSVSANRKSVN